MCVSITPPLFCTLRRMDDRVVYPFSAFSAPIWQRMKKNEKFQKKEKKNTTFQVLTT